MDMGRGEGRLGASFQQVARFGVEVVCVPAHFVNRPETLAGVFRDQALKLFRVLLLKPCDLLHVKVGWSAPTADQIMW